MLQQYRYEIGPEEYLAYQKYHVEHDRAIASRIFWMRWLITLGILLVGVLLEAVGRIGMIAIIPFAVLAVCAGCSFRSGCATACARRPKRSTRRALHPTPR